MSLINEMLRDLERRKAGDLPVEGVVLSGIGWPPAGSRRPWGRYVAAGAVAVILLSAYGVYVGQVPPGGDETAPSGPGGGAAGASTAGRADGPPLAAAAGAAGTAAAKAAASAADLTMIGGIARPGAVTAGDIPAPPPPAHSANGDGPAGDAVAYAHPAPVPEGTQGAADRRTHPAQADHHKRVQTVGKSRPPAVRRAARVSPAQRAARLHRAALALIRDGRTDEARDKLADAMALAPDYVPGRRDLAGLMVKAGQLHAAAALLDEGLRLAPQDPSLVKLRARIDVMQGHNRTARKLLEGHPPAMSEDPSYYALLAAVYQRLGDYGPAASLYERLVAARPGNGVWWTGLGIAKEATGKHDEARRAYTKAEHTDALSPALRRFVRSKLATR